MVFAGIPNRHCVVVAYMARHGSNTIVHEAFSCDSLASSLIDELRSCLGCIGCSCIRVTLKRTQRRALAVVCRTAGAGEHFLSLADFKRVVDVRAESVQNVNRFRCTWLVVVAVSMESSMVTGVASFNELVCTFVDLVLVRFHGPTSVLSRRRRNSRPLPAT
jgi:hypothetical protein